MSSDILFMLKEEGELPFGIIIEEKNGSVL